MNFQRHVDPRILVIDLKPRVGRLSKLGVKPLLGMDEGTLPVAHGDGPVGLGCLQISQQIDAKNRLDAGSNGSKCYRGNLLCRFVLGHFEGFNATQVVLEEITIDAHEVPGSVVVHNE